MVKECRPLLLRKGDLPQLEELRPPTCAGIAQGSLVMPSMGMA